MIRVLHVLNWFRRGGLETLLLRILRDYDRSRFHMDACCIGKDEGHLADEALPWHRGIRTPGVGEQLLFLLGLLPAVTTWSLSREGRVVWRRPHAP